MKGIQRNNLALDKIVWEIIFLIGLDYCVEANNSQNYLFIITYCAVGEMATFGSHIATYIGPTLYVNVM